MNDNLLPVAFHVCSCCLAENGFQDLSTEYTWLGRKEVYGEMLSFAFNITIDNALGEAFICDECIRRLRDASNFKSQVQQTQMNLAQCVQLHEQTGQHSDEVADTKELQKPNKSELTKATFKDLKQDSLKFLQNTSVVPFRWHKNNYGCFCCNKRFESFSNLKNHMSVHSFHDIKDRIIDGKRMLYHKVEVSSISCKLCMRSIQNYADIKNHLSSLHGIMFENDSNLLIPYKLDGGNECAICNKTFSVFHKLNIHMNKHYQNHICELCGRGFKCKQNMKNHIERHNKTYKCHKCNLNFDTEHKRNLHSNKKHNTVLQRPCLYCSERFTSHYSRLVHMINIHDHKKSEYNCPHCGRKFLRQFLVNSHIRKFHLRERNYECDICSHKFFGLSDMRQHRLSHTGEKNFSCPVCAKLYVRKATLVQHMKTQHQERKE